MFGPLAITVICALAGAMVLSVTAVPALASLLLPLLSVKIYGEDLAQLSKLGDELVAVLGKVRGAGGQLVLLSQLATVQVEDGPAQVSRENAQRRLTVEANVHGRDLKGFVDETKERIGSEWTPGDAARRASRVRRIASSPSASATWTASYAVKLSRSVRASSSA